MLFKTKDKVSGKTLYRTKPLLLTAQQAYTRPPEGRAWFQTTTTVWRVDEMIRRSVRDWRRLLNETGHTGSRTGAMRKDHDSHYTGTTSIFPAPLVEWILLRYAPSGGKILDAFAGGPPRAVVACIMGYEYVGYDIRQEQLRENTDVLNSMELGGYNYMLGDGVCLNGAPGPFDCALTCPPYFNLEVYSDLETDLSNCENYQTFNTMMYKCAQAHFPLMKPGAFVCIVVGPFRDKKTGELIDFPGHTVDNFRRAGFVYHQQVVLSKNFASAAKRSTMAWKGHKLVPAHEFLLVFRKPNEKNGSAKQAEGSRPSAG